MFKGIIRRKGIHGEITREMHWKPSSIFFEKVDEQYLMEFQEASQWKFLDENFNNFLEQFLEESIRNVLKNLAQILRGTLVILEDIFWKSV